MSTSPRTRQPRPYTLTNGRTKPRRNIPIDGVVVRSTRGEQAVASLRGPAGEVLDVCDQPISVSDIAGVLRLPVGVIRVLVDDLVADRLVHVRIPADERTLDLGRLERGERRPGTRADRRS